MGHHHAHYCLCIWWEAGLMFDINDCELYLFMIWFRHAARGGGHARKRIWYDWLGQTAKCTAFFLVCSAHCCFAHQSHPYLFTCIPQFLRRGAWRGRRAMLLKSPIVGGSLLIVWMHIDPGADAKACTGVWRRLLRVPSAIFTWWDYICGSMDGGTSASVLDICGSMDGGTSASVHGVCGSMDGGTIVNVWFIGWWDQCQCMRWYVVQWMVDPLTMWVFWWWMDGCMDGWWRNGGFNHRCFIVHPWQVLAGLLAHCRCWLQLLFEAIALIYVFVRRDPLLHLVQVSSAVRTSSSSITFEIEAAYNCLFWKFFIWFFNWWRSWHRRRRWRRLQRSQYPWRRPASYLFLFMYNGWLWYWVYEAAVSSKVMKRPKGSRALSIPDWPRPGSLSDAEEVYVSYTH